MFTDSGFIRGIFSELRENTLLNIAIYCDIMTSQKIRRYYNVYDLC